MSLQTLYSDLNELWAKAEHRVKSLLIFNEVIYEFEPGECIAWAKAKGSMRLCYGERGDVEQPWNFDPVTDCNANVRIDLIPTLPRLNQLLNDEIGQAEQRLTTAITTFKRILNEPS